ncbi:MAG: methylenetetrahydrofolate reductase [NAD(P)H] [Cardiobacteriaceae bacterium]|nr:methylenetetrahydrofolate reductase [NAD(P)H] [Cardiobacteriaceae bacterium]
MSVTKIPLSCEFFPTATPEGAEKLATVRQELAFLQCEYYSVTYGAGGSTRDRTMNLVARLSAENGPPAMPHLTCVASTEAEIRTLLDDYRALGINRLMALRGDMPSGAFENAGFHTAQHLVSYVRHLWGDDARIYVAAYPEVHPRARTPMEDVQSFRDKVMAGATDAVTQYFYNVDAYLRFRDDVQAQGVNIPLVPGIMPISNFVQLSRFSDACGTEIPRWLRKRLEALQDNIPTLCDYGADVVAQICERLIAEGAPALHFYSMNRADLIIELSKRLGWY